MKRNFLRFLRMVGLMIILCCDICYADIVDPMSRFKQSGQEAKEALMGNIIQIIIIGGIIVAIVVVAIIVLEKNKAKKNTKLNDVITEEGTKEKGEEKNDESNNVVNDK